MSRPISLTFGALFICLMAIGANITVWFPMLAVPIGGTSVPLSLQTFFSILAGFILGKRLGPLAIVTYIFIGIVGIPVFAGLKAGPMIVLLPTGGFILSFIVVAYIVGLLGSNNREAQLKHYIYVSLVGVFFNYVIGVTYMYFSMKIFLDIDITYLIAWSSMIPFLIKDTFLAILAALFIKRIHKLLPQSIS